MWKDFPLLPDSASSMSGRVDAVYLFLICVSAFFATLICALILVFAFRYARKPGRPRGADIHGSLPLELVWTLVPLGLTMIMFVWGAKLFFQHRIVPADATDVYVVGKQWMWKLQHPTGQREINDLHVPVGTAVKLTMTSEDVIHSFFVPAFRMKMDVLPGRTTHAWFRATKPGEYHLFCAEYCGTKHSAMVGRIHAMEPQEYERWLGGANVGETPAESGRRLFESLRCDTCHEDVSHERGPTLRGEFGSEIELADGTRARVDEDFVRESLLRPLAKVRKGYEPLMPSYDGQLGEEQVFQIIAYLKTLAAEGEDAGHGAGDAGGRR